MAELQVVIKDESGNQTTTTASPQVENPTPTQNINTVASAKTKEAKETKASSNGMAIASMIGSQAFNYTTSNIGKWTGSSKTQNGINTIKQIGGIAAMAYMNPYMALANVAIQMGTTAIDSAFELRVDKLSSNQRLARAGYSSTGEVVGRRH